MLVVAVVVGCGSPECETLGDEALDACLYERAQERLAAGEVQPAVQDAGAIVDPTLRAAAIETLIASGGLQRMDAQQLCSTLDEPHRSSCRKTWERPHLWE